MLAILSANIQGLCPSKGKFKLDMLKEMAISEGVGILALTESHLNPNYHEGEIAIDNYGHFRADRAAEIRKGWVIVYVRSELLPGVKALETGSIENIEYIVLNIVAANLILVCIYRPPGSLTQPFMDVLQRVRDCLIMAPTSSTIALCGDLNFPIIDWTTYSVHGGTSSTRHQANMLLELFEDFFLLQYVEHPTRGKNILDIFATNDDELVLRVRVLSKSKISDHNITIIDTTQYLKETEDKIKDQNSLHALNFWSRNINWEELRAEINSYNWNNLFRGLNPEEIYNKLCMAINEVCFTNVPR